MNHFSVRVETAAGPGPELAIDAVEEFTASLSRLSGVNASALVQPALRAYSATINADAMTPAEAEAAARSSFEKAAIEAGLPVGEIVVHDARSYATV